MTSAPSATTPRAMLFSSVRSPHCFKVSIALHEKGAPVDRIEIDLPAREQTTPAYLAIQPRGTVPADRDAHADTELREVSHHLYWQWIEPPKEGPDEARVRELRAKGDEKLGAIEAALAEAGNGWLGPTEDVPRPSLADIAVYTWSGNVRCFDLPSEAAPEMPHLRSWWARLDERPSVVASRNAKGRPFAAWLAEKAGP